MVLDQAAQVVEEMGQVELDRLAAAQAEGIGAGEARAQLMTGLAERVPTAAEEIGGLALPELELLEGVGHEVAPFRPGERLRCFDQQVAQPCRDLHGSASLTEQGRYSTINASLCGPVIFFRPPKTGLEGARRRTPPGWRTPPTA